MGDHDPRPPQRQHPRHDMEIRVDWSTGRRVDVVVKGAVRVS